MPSAIPDIILPYRDLSLLDHGNRIEQRAVFTLCDLDGVIPRGEGEAHYLVTVVIAMHFVPVPAIAGLDLIESHPTTGIVAGIGRHARNPNPEGIVSSGNEHSECEPVHAILSPNRTTG